MRKPKIGNDYVKYKWINFQRTLPLFSKAKTQTYEIRSNRSNDLLGTIKWHSPWRQYCFISVENCIFNRACLGDISAFIQTLMADRK